MAHWPIGWLAGRSDYGHIQAELVEGGGAAQGGYVLNWNGEVAPVVHQVIVCVLACVSVCVCVSACACVVVFAFSSLGVEVFY